MVKRNEYSWAVTLTWDEIHTLHSRVFDRSSLNMSSHSCHQRAWKGHTRETKEFPFLLLGRTRIVLKLDWNWIHSLDSLVFLNNIILSSRRLSFPCVSCGPQFQSQERNSLRVISERVFSWWHRVFSVFVLNPEKCADFSSELFNFWSVLKFSSLLFDSLFLTRLHLSHELPLFPLFSFYSCRVNRAWMSIWSSLPERLFSELFYISKGKENKNEHTRWRLN